MIEVDRLQKTIAEYLPNAEKDVIERISLEVARETELFSYELIRLFVSQEKEKAYLRDNR